MGIIILKKYFGWFKEIPIRTVDGQHQERNEYISGKTSEESDLLEEDSTHRNVNCVQD